MYYVQQFMHLSAPYELPRANNHRLPGFSFVALTWTMWELHTLAEYEICIAVVNCMHALTKDR